MSAPPSERLVLVVGPSGIGKSTSFLRKYDLPDQRRLRCRSNGPAVGSLVGGARHDCRADWGPLIDGNDMLNRPSIVPAATTGF